MEESLELRSLRRALKSNAGVDEALRAYFLAASAASQEVRDAMLRALAEPVAQSDCDRAGSIALIAGAIVERGGDPRAFPPAVFDALLEQLLRITAHDDELELPDGYYLLERAAMACLSRSLELRNTLPQKAKLRAAIRRYSERYGFLGKMLAVLDGEPIIVLHPSTGRGFRLVIGGIPDNFTLHHQLLVALAGDRPEQIPGEVPASTGSVSSTWQLACWTGLLPDGGIDNAHYNRDWIWNEGVPEDITPFEGTRVVLIGSGISRGWNAGLVFAAMPPMLRREGLMEKAEVQALLGRILRARPLPS